MSAADSFPSRGEGKGAAGANAVQRGLTQGNRKKERFIEIRDRISDARQDFLVPVRAPCTQLWSLTHKRTSAHVCTYKNAEKQAETQESEGTPATRSTMNSTAGQV